MRMWIDTEFNEYHGALISLALVAEDGREWYGVRYCDDPGWWVREHVMPHILQQPERDADLREGLAVFLGQFDAVHIISDWPGDIAHFCNFLEFAPGDRIGPDTMIFEVRRDLPDTATTSTIPHNALEDARALARVGHNVELSGADSSRPTRTAGCTPLCGFAFLKITLDTLNTPPVLCEPVGKLNNSKGETS